MKIFTAFALLLIANFAVAQPSIPVSMIQLIANPQKFDGRAVRVIGFLRLEFEGDAVYLHEQDFKKRIPSNAISIDLSEQQMQKFEKLNNGYVVVEGTFNAAEKGHFDIFSGTLQKVSKLSNWSVARNSRVSRK